MTHLLDNGQFLKQNDHFLMENDRFMHEMANFDKERPTLSWKWPFWSNMPNSDQIENDQFSLENARFVHIFVQLFLDQFFIMIIQYGRQWGGIEQCRTEYVLEHIRRFHQKRIFYTSYFPPNILWPCLIVTVVRILVSWCPRTVENTL